MIFRNIAIVLIAILIAGTIGGCLELEKEAVNQPPIATIEAFGAQSQEDTIEERPFFAENAEIEYYYHEDVTILVINDSRNPLYIDVLNKGVDKTNISVEILMRQTLYRDNVTVSPGHLYRIYIYPDAPTLVNICFGEKCLTNIIEITPEQASSDPGVGTYNGRYYMSNNTYDTDSDASNFEWMKSGPFVFPDKEKVSSEISLEQVFPA